MLQEKSNSGAGTLKKELGVFDLTMLGVGCVVGTGIFVLTGVAAAEHAGLDCIPYLDGPWISCLFLIRSSAQRIGQAK
ncbi:hypothetical protein GCM10008013_36720 [Paenibacillus segetis]|uniref:Amino acid permease n=1 Tax=Paenibacillus segetis TaxID=1325360 RepID=A0ABQ1YQ38_9BACL|nr:hypothetical protein GCM10008013_36720 [Paenibacillus segetis]